MTKAAIGQICSTASVQHNLEQCVTLARRAAEAGAKVLFLPEASDYIASSAAESLALAVPVASSPFVAGLQAAARAHDIAINVGVHDPEPASAGPARLYNRTIHIEASGELLVPATYTKLHLFDFPAAGLVESAHTAPGAALAPPFATAVGRIGALVCFDLRFAEAALALAQPGPGSAWRDAPAQLLTYPSAFTVPTGRAHWELLLRARAVEAQAFVVAAAQVGRHHDVGRGRVSYGRSMVVDPWGTVLCALGAAGEDGTVDDGAVGQLGVVDIDLALWEDVRAKMPLVRRRDIFPGV